ncbi:hypothetical protein RN001_011491 [Aquatica leii]|uniref:Upstream activation factor subunit spp27 n=1 Tax=Aquatica leii TaxID=1421715 RepID=A0AAN7SEK4_9COLE|nr:hypothetical protein RN001_011491 [Aquatica leii]
MADISKEDLRKEITAILKDADLASTSAKKVRQQLEEKLDANLLSRKKEIDTLVMEFVNSKDNTKKKSKKSDSEEDDEENEEEEEDDVEEDEEGSEDEKKDSKRASTGKKPVPKKAKKGSDSEASEPSDEGESEEEYSPKKSKPPKTRKLPPKKKKGSESDSDEDWAKTKKGSKKGGQGGGGGGAGGGKRAGSGYTKSMTLSPELAALVGQSTMARHEVVKKIWDIIKERDLYDPKNKQFAICDDALLKVIGVKRFRTFGMMKYLKSHFIS